MNSAGRDTSGSRISTCWAAPARGLEAYNGWTFWHIETPKGLTVIDALHAQVRPEMGAC